MTKYVLENTEEDRKQVEELPTEKLIEALNKTTGKIQHCPECGVKTAFIGTAGHNSTSDCHECGYTKRL